MKNVKAHVPSEQIRAQLIKEGKVVPDGAPVVRITCQGSCGQPFDRLESRPSEKVCGCCQFKRKLEESSRAS